MFLPRISVCLKKIVLLISANVALVIKLSMRQPYQINASCDQFKFLSSSVLCFEVTEHPNDKSNNYVAVLTYLGKM